MKITHKSEQYDTYRSQVIFEFVKKNEGITKFGFVGCGSSGVDIYCVA